MDRISVAFENAKKQGRACFISYLCAGDPDFDQSLQACRAVIENGTDILELGVPFSDPLADGLTNQLAAQRALESGMTQEKVLKLVREIRKFSEVPIVFYTYYNLVFSGGVDHYVKAAREAGVDGMLTLDLPPEEADELLTVSRAAGIKNIFIVAPTTPESRMARIAAAASGFLYYVSRTGVTGVRNDLAADIGDAIRTIKKHTDLPVVVGFGISKREQVSQVAAVADGVVVGSALVNTIRDHLDDAAAMAATLGGRVADLAAGVSRS